MLSQAVIQELLEYFYCHQYGNDCYPCYDMVTEYDMDGNSFRCVFIV